MRRPPRLSATIRLLVVVLGLALGRARAISPGEGRAIVTGELEEILGKASRIRDWAPFETERGEGALLVLYATAAVEPPDDATLPATPTCAETVTGIPLAGRYHVALVVGGTLVNVVDVPGETPLRLPLSNRIALNARYYGQPSGGDPAEAEETRLVRLADFTGDGNAWEFRLVRPGDCEHVGTLLAGYSAGQRRAILFPIVRGTERRFWEDDFFPAPTAPDARRVTVRSRCAAGDASIEKFLFDPRREAWVLARTRHRPCASPAGDLRAAAAIRAQCRR